MDISTSGFNYFCDHNSIKDYDYLDLGLVLFPNVKGHFGIIRYGTEVIVFDINEFVKTKKIEKKDVLWYKEYWKPEDAYYQAIDIYKELVMALNGIQDPTLRFPSIYSNLDSSETLFNANLLKNVAEAFQAYGEGIVHGINDGLDLIETNKNWEDKDEY